MKKAVIDIGSNSVRLMMLANGKVLYKRLNTTRIGEGLAQSPYLKIEAIERTAEAVREFVHFAKAEGASEVVAFATAAVRSAENKQEFLSKVQALCSLQMQVISGEEEAELGILGALGENDGGVIDVGGASTEIVLKAQGEIKYKQSENVGVVRLKDACGRDLEQLTAFCEQAVGKFKPLFIKENIYAIGGTATTLAALVLNLQTYNSLKVTGTRITKEKMQAFFGKLEPYLLAYDMEEMKKRIE
jgi:exopolyphosphatase/guanosine-5'-triphosphate,3'-diphosphate pyrophosphatase